MTTTNNSKADLEVNAPVVLQVQRWNPEGKTYSTVWVADSSPCAIRFTSRRERAAVFKNAAVCKNSTAYKMMADGHERIEAV